jgi:hypothetical protein
VLDAPSSTTPAANDIDPSAVWFFSLWPHAIVHGLNPFHRELIFAPDGFGCAQCTSASTLQG